jgi:hypothetical protein
VRFQYCDGGRKASGFKGQTGDCTIRAIAIVDQRPYLDVYEEMNAFVKKTERRSKLKKLRGFSSSRSGVWGPTIRRYMKSKGFTWVPTMHIGSGCTVHLREDELPPGRLIVNLARHLTSVIDGVIYDTFDPTVRTTEYYPLNHANIPKAVTLSDCGKWWLYKPDRCVYGYYFRP